MAVIAVLTSACGPDPGSAEWLKDAVKRSEYVLVCNTDTTGEHVEYQYVKTLHVRPGVTVPFRPGDSLGHFGTKIEDDVTCPDRAAVIFEKIGKQVRMSSINSIFDPATPNSSYTIADLVKPDEGN